MKKLLIGLISLLASAPALAALSVSLSANPATGNAPFATALSWTVSGGVASTVCTASGSWTGAKALSGSQNVTNLLSDATYTLICVTPAVPSIPAVLATANLRWIPPTQNTDGSSLTNLAGFRALYGSSASALSQTIDIPGAGVAAYTVEGLTTGTWFFAVKAYTSNGAESDLSNVVSIAKVATPAVPGKPAENAFKTFVVKVNSQPKPPTGLTVDDPTAYRIDIGYQNQLKAAKIGTVPLGKPCVETLSPFSGKPVDFMGLNVLKDRMAAALTPGVSRPNQVLAKCSVKLADSSLAVELERQ